jgi:hypothetical protein
MASSNRDFTYTLNDRILWSSFFLSVLIHLVIGWLFWDAHIHEKKLLHGNLGGIKLLQVRISGPSSRNLALEIERNIPPPQKKNIQEKQFLPEQESAQGTLETSQKEVTSVTSFPEDSFPFSSSSTRASVFSLPKERTPGQQSVDQRNQYQNNRFQNALRKFPVITTIIDNVSPSGYCIFHFNENNFHAKLDCSSEDVEKLVKATLIEFVYGGSSQPEDHCLIFGVPEKGVTCNQ